MPSISGRGSTWIVTHNAVSIPASGNGFGSWINCDGYDKISFHLVNDAATSSLGSIDWSFDGGTTTASSESGLIPNNTTQRKNAITDVKAPYVRITYGNQDGALAHVMTGWAYMRA